MCELFGEKIRPIYTVCDITETHQIKRFFFLQLELVVFIVVFTQTHISQLILEINILKIVLVRL